MIKIVKQYNEEYQYVEYKCVDTEYDTYFPWMDEYVVSTHPSMKEALETLEQIKIKDEQAYALVLDNTEANSFFVCPLGQAYECESNYSGYEIIHKGTYLEMSQLEDEWKDQNVIPFGL